MPDKLAISKHLSEVLQDWRESRSDFPANTHPDSHWPIPFFGNPATTTVATVGVNPSSGEFRPDRNWNTVQNAADWKRRLKNYFNQPTPPHEWFAPWRVGLALLGLDYENGSAAHFDVSYRSTKAMLKNRTTNVREFRRMVEHDVAWFFRLLPLCPNLRLLLVFGPIVRANGSTESLAQYLRNNAPQNGFKVSQDGKFWSFKHLDSGKTICVHEVSTPGEKCITCRVVKNLHVHRHELRRRLVERFNEALLQYISARMNRSSQITTAATSTPPPPPVAIQTTKEKVWGQLETKKVRLRALFCAMPSPRRNISTRITAFIYGLITHVRARKRSARPWLRIPPLPPLSVKRL